MSTKLKSITETSWLVIGDNEDYRIGLLTRSTNEYILMIHGEKQKFLDRKEVNKYFKEDIFKEISESVSEEKIKKDYYINGYPVEFDSPNEVVVPYSTLPLFSKKSLSNTYYSAGYYCLHFPKNWMPAFCPKLSTLESYEYAGPFKTEFEMRVELVRLRKTKKNTSTKITQGI
jgi:hypothetical protein